MGSASATVDGEQQEAPLHFPSLPMENSPPEIHTMPSGATLGGAVVFGIVGRNADEAAVLFVCAGVSACRTTALQANAVARANATLGHVIFKFVGHIATANRLPHQLPLLR